MHYLPSSFFPFPLSHSGFSGGSNGKESTYNAEDLGLIPELGRSPGEGHDNPLQYSCLENSTDRGTWWTTVHRVAKSWTQLKQLSMRHHQESPFSEHRTDGFDNCLLKMEQMHPNSNWKIPKPSSQQIGPVIYMR